MFQILECATLKLKMRAQTEQGADWHLTTGENELIDDHARLNIDRQADGECGK